VSAEEQTIDNVVLQCPILQTPLGMHGLTVLDDKTIKWLLNTCLRCSTAKQWISTTGSNDEEAKTHSCANGWVTVMNKTKEVKCGMMYSCHTRIQNLDITVATTINANCMSAMFWTPNFFKSTH